MPLPSRPSIMDIARAAGVSPVLVSSVVTGYQSDNAPVSPEIAGRVRAAMASLGYRDQEGPGKDEHRLRMVLMLVRRLSSASSRMLVEHVQSALSTKGLCLAIQEGEGIESLATVSQLLDDGAIQGLIVETDDETAEPLERMAASSHPIVAIGPRTGSPSHDVITIDDGNAIREAVLSLIERRIERFILISPRDDSNRDHATTVARDQVRALGVAPEQIRTLYSSHDTVAAFNAFSAGLDTLTTPVGVVAGSDSCAIGVLWACIRAGLRVPDDVAILGHGNSPQSEITSPAISTIGPDRDGLRRAADLMLERLDQPSLAGRHIIEPWAFISREST